MTTPEVSIEEATRSPARPRLVPRFLESILAAGRGFLDRRRAGQTPAATLAELCRDLLVRRGEASGLALASDITADYEALSSEERLEFFRLLNEGFSSRAEDILAAAERFREEGSFSALSALAQALQSPRLELFRRLNMTPGGTLMMVNMRGHLLDLLPAHPELKPIEADLHQLLIAWFNRGFLVLDRIDWDSPASVLEKIIQYEAVHEVSGWEDLRQRLQDDRRCFAFFHVAIPHNPLIFVQVALTDGIVHSIQPLISVERVMIDPLEADTAMFYSISNCHKGLQGVSFGHFLIKQVVDELHRDHPNIKQFATLSPVPGFRAWLDSVCEGAMQDDEGLRDDLQQVRDLLAKSQWGEHELEEFREPLLRLCAHYLLEVKRETEPLDPVARFHLANGASLDWINWAADFSPIGLQRSFGIMVNYVYNLKDIEKNHEGYFRDGTIAAGSGVRKLAKSR